jgi:uncharacterized protein (TIGR03086 family)
MPFEGIVDRYTRASAAFETVLRQVRADQWDDPTPCTEWSVRLLVNHMAQGNRNYIPLLEGANGAEFMGRRGLDALGNDPLGAFAASAADCAAAFARPGVLDRVLDYPLGRLSAAQALAVRTTDSVIHTWDLARAIGADETLDPEQLQWIEAHLESIYAGLDEVPTAPDSTHKFFGSPTSAGADASRQERVLRRMGRTP